MPLFYFDAHDGSKTLHDRYGDVWDSIEEAADHAASMLPAMAADVIPRKKPKAFASIVRDENDHTVYRSVMLFREEWPDRDRPGIFIGRDRFELVISEAHELMRSARDLQKEVSKTILHTLSCLERTRAEIDLSRRARASRARRPG